MTIQLESIYRSADVVANICVYAKLDKAKPIAIIVPAEPALKKLAAEHDIEGNGLEDLAHNGKLQGHVLSLLQAAGRKGGLAGIEIIEGVVLADEEWNPQNVRHRELPPLLRTSLTMRLGLDHFRAEDQPQRHLGEVQEASGGRILQ